MVKLIILQIAKRKTSSLQFEMQVMVKKSLPEIIQFIAIIQRVTKTLHLCA